VHSLHLAQGAGIPDDPMPEVRWVWYRGTSLIRNTPLLGPTEGLYLGTYGVRQVCQPLDGLTQPAGAGVGGRQPPIASTSPPSLFITSPIASPFPREPPPRSPPEPSTRPPPPEPESRLWSGQLTSPEPWSRKSSLEWATSPEPIKSSLEWAAAKKSRLWSGRTPRARAQTHGTFKTCRSRQSRPLFGNLRWGGPYLSNTENSRAVFAPSEILRGFLGAARERPPLHAPRPPSPGVWPRAADAAPPRPQLRPVRGGERAQTRLGPFPRRDHCFYWRGIKRRPARSSSANQIEAAYFR